MPRLKMRKVEKGKRFKDKGERFRVQGSRFRVQGGEVLNTDTLYETFSKNKKIEPQRREAREGFLFESVHQPIKRWLVHRFEQRAHALRARESLAHHLSFWP